MTFTYDGELDIATASSGQSKQWKNQSKPWSQIVSKLSKTHRTHERVKEYHAMNKAQQGSIKDIGGFVGGYLAGGRRKRDTVMYRQIITLDLDHGTPEWDDFAMMYDCAACMYSTHKHTPDAPRLRLIIPLAETVDSEQYEAIARRIAGDVGIEFFDLTTFQASRLMFWPSTPQDGVYLFEQQDGPWLDPAKVLGRYVDWRDSSAWPVSERATALVRHEAAKQGDPTEKNGMIGYFCRTFTITEAIDTFLSDTYEPCDIDGRYSYKQGSTAGGLVIYDDLFAYSHHGTDPAGSKLSNAFDLVRLHKFGLRDENKEHYAMTDLPSYKDMCDWIAQQPEVRRTIAVERLRRVDQDFADVDLSAFDDIRDIGDLAGSGSESGSGGSPVVGAQFAGDWGLSGGAPPEVEGGDSTDWLSQLECDKKGNVLPSTNNIVLILRNDKRLRDRFGFDEFENAEAARYDLPWRKVRAGRNHLTDSDDSHLRHYIETAYDISSPAKLRDAMSVVVQEHRFHPIREFLRGLTWDGERRLDTVFIDYMGADDNHYVRQVTRKWFTAAVARVFEPGIKFDTMIVLLGEQGVGKSTLFKRMGGPWFSDTLHNVGSKEALEQLQGSWILELAELSALRRSDVETVKHFVSKQEDKYREAYGHRTGKFLRQCVFAGTSNNYNFLKDVTGNRRFWPIATYVHPASKDMATGIDSTVVRQLWAEAVHCYDNGEPLFLDKATEALAKDIQELHTEIDDRVGMVQQYLETKVPEDWCTMTVFERRAYLQDDIAPLGTMTRNKVCTLEIYAEVFGGRIDTVTRQNLNDIGNLMRAVKGWDRTNERERFDVYGPQRFYQRTGIKFPTARFDLQFTKSTN